MEAKVILIVALIASIASKCCGLAAEQNENGNRLIFVTDMKLTPKPSKSGKKPITAKTSAAYDSKKYAVEDLCTQNKLISDAVRKNNCCRPRDPLFFYPDFSSDTYCKTGAKTVDRKLNKKKTNDSSLYSECRRKRRGCGEPKSRFGHFIDDVVNASSLSEIVDLYWRRQNFYKCTAVTNNTIKQAEECLTLSKKRFCPAKVYCDYGCYGDSDKHCTIKIEAYNVYEKIILTERVNKTQFKNCAPETLVDCPKILNVHTCKKCDDISVKYELCFKCPSKCPKKHSDKSTSLYPLTDTTDTTTSGSYSNNSECDGSHINKSFEIKEAGLALNIAQNFANNPVNTDDVWFSALGTGVAQGDLQGAVANGD